MADFDYPLSIPLIELVQSHPHLYDKSLVEFKDDLVRSKTIRKIAKRLEISEGEVVQKWKKLRERYTREKKKIIRSGSKASTNQWPYLKQMSFLDKFIRQRQRNSYRRSISPKPRSRSRFSLRPRAPVLQYLSNSSNSSVHSSPPSPRSRSESPSVPLPKLPTLSPQLTPEPPQYAPKKELEKNISPKPRSRSRSSLRPRAPVLQYLSNSSNSSVHSSPPSPRSRSESPSVPLPKLPTLSPQLTPEPLQHVPKEEVEKNINIKKGDEFELLASNQLFGEYLVKRLDDFSPNRAKDIRKKIVLLLETDDKFEIIKK